MFIIFDFPSALKDYGDMLGDKLITYLLLILLSYLQNYCQLHLPVNAGAKNIWAGTLLSLTPETQTFDVT